MKGKVGVIVVSLLLAIAGVALAYWDYYWWSIIPVAVLFLLHKTLGGLGTWIRRRVTRNGREIERK